MTIKFYNTNDTFGDGGPHEADSKEALADEWEPTLREWAQYEEYKEAGYTLEQWIEMKKDEFIDGLEAEYHGEPRIVFDNGGGITLQLPGFAHHYTDAEQCAQDICNWEDDRDTTGWEGNEEESVFEPTQDQIHNGGYRVWTLADFNNRSNWDELKNSSWANIAALFERLQ